MVKNAVSTSQRRAQARIVEQPCQRQRQRFRIGGAGKMGRWFSDFMASQGYTVTVADPAVTPGDLVAYAKTVLSANKYPREIRIVPALPLAGLNKVAKGELRRLALMTAEPDPNSHG